MEKVAFQWQPRTIPLRPTALVAIGPVAYALATKLLSRPDALPRLRGVAGPELLAIVGDEAVLPWVDGVQYLGHDADAPSLLLPTQLIPSVPVGLVERALQRTYPSVRPPLAVLPQSQRLVSLVAARPIDRAQLEEWLTQRAQAAA